MTIAAYNPSTIGLKSIQFAVPDGNYSVKVWDSGLQKFVDNVESVVNCYDDYLSNETSINSCFMTVTNTSGTLVVSRGVQVIVLEHFKEGESKTLENKPLGKGDFIENENIKVTFLAKDDASSLVKFSYLDK
jgi:hypothetical protein